MDMRASGVALQPESNFLECHYYKGGHRTEYVSLSGSRPLWAPPADWVGFRDETSLKDGDRIVEVVKFDTPSGAVVWVGLFRHSPDKVYGDRQNHAGLGTWLLGHFPSDPDLLVEGLEKLLHVFSESTAEEFSQKAAPFLRDYLSEYLSPLHDLPPPLGGIRSAVNQVFSTRSFQIARRAEGWPRKLNDLFFRIFFLSTGGDDFNRALILLRDEGQVGGSQALSGFEDFKKERFAAELLSKLPVALEDQSKLLAELKNHAATRDRAIEELDNRVDQLQAALASEQERAAALDRQYNELKAAFAEDDDRKRFSILHQGLSNVNSQVSTLGREILALRGEIVADLKRELTGFLRSGPTGGPQYTGVENLYESRPSRAHDNAGVQVDWGKVFVLAAALIAVLGLITYFLIR